MIDTVQHHLLFTDFESDMPESVGVTGQCSCSAYFELNFNKKDMELVFMITGNNYPPCPAVAVARHFEKELA